MGYPKASNPVARAVAIVGSQSALARLLGVTPQSVSRWVQSGCAPAKRIVQIEHATAGRVTRQELKPELYGNIAPYVLLNQEQEVTL